MTLIIHGQTPSKKNSKQLFRNKHTGKMFVASSKLMFEWEPSAIMQVNVWRANFGIRKLISHVKIHFFFYRKDTRPFDYVNICQAPLDVLVKCGIVEDDNMKFVTPVFDGWTVDKEDPRCKMTFVLDEFLTYIKT